MDDNLLAQSEGHFTDYGSTLIRRLYFEALLAQGTLHVTDNGNGSYTYEWRAKPVDTEQTEQPETDDGQTTS